MKNIAIIGECMIELNGKPFGAMHQTFGGDTLNAAVYLSRGCELNTEEQAITVSYVSAMGADPLSEGMIARWQQEGINTDLVLHDENRTPGLYLIQLDDQGERTFLYWRNQSPARYLLRHPDFNRIEQSLTKMDMVFVSGISLAILPDEDRSKLLTLLADLRRQGVEVSFDSNYRPALWPNDELRTVKEHYKAMYQTTDLALVTFDDEQLIWGDKTPEDTLTRLHNLGVTKVVVKLGEKGCLVGDTTHDNSYTVPTIPVETVIDTTSAGDSFNGGFLSCYLAGGSLEQSCQRGNALAGVVIQHRGAIIPKSATDVVTQI
ncbi:sugar kinase [Vibrio paucivorans]|uniref:2-dehydro-3-deoxygluconokinase n=1 Tax=Vibrio paucivorans TaxID=2829489 RepID=A0A9X3CGZ4_9VIBR|nr:sugar kinase [Vibrio paucivorans]MCW8335687.1 sugar kinase [Vibrio paucivorans]